MNPSSRNTRRFRVHMVPRETPDAMYLKIIEEAKDLDELERKRYFELKEKVENGQMS